MNYFYVDGISSREYDVIITGVNPYAAPSLAYEIDFLDGASTPHIERGDHYDAIVRSYELSVMEDLSPKTLALRNWLVSSSKMKNREYRLLSDTYNPYHYMRTYHIGGLESFMQNFNRFGKGTIDFLCDGYRYLKSGRKSDARLYGTSRFFNPTTEDAEPIFTIFADAGSAEISFSVNGITLFIENTGVNVVVDCEQLTVKSENGFSLSEHTTVSGGHLEELKFLPGENVVYSSYPFRVIKNWREL